MKDNCIINIDNSINSGQVFLWKKNNGYWYGVNGQDVIQINENGIINSFQNLRTDFFRKDDNLDKIIKSISFGIRFFHFLFSRSLFFTSNKFNLIHLCHVS